MDDEDDYWSWVPPTEDEIREQEVYERQITDFERGMYDSEWSEGRF